MPRMQNMILSLVLGLLILLADGVASAHEDKLDEPVEISSFTSDITSITIAHPLDLPPLCWSDSRGVPQGILVDFWKLWSKQTGVPIQFVGAPLHECQRKVADGTWDVLIGTVYMHERAESLSFSRAFMDLPTVLFGRKDQNFGGLEDLSGKVVGVIRGEWTVAVLEKQAPGVRLRQYGIYRNLVQSALAGEVDYFSMSLPAASYFLNEMDTEKTFHRLQNLAIGRVCAAVQKGNFPLLRLVDLGIAQIRMDEIETIQKQWLPDAGLSEQTWRYLIIGGVAFLLCLAGGHALLLRSQVRQRTQLLQAAEEKYRILVENASEGIAVSQGEYFQFVNSRLAQMLDYTPEEMLKTRIRDFIHPEDRSMVMDRQRKRMAGEDVPSKYPLRVQTATGQEKWIQLSAVPVAWMGKPGSLDFITDITDLKWAEQALRESQQRFRSIVQRSPMGILLFELRQNECLMLTDSNAAADDILRRSHDALRDKPLAQVLPVEGAPKLKEIFYRAAGGGEGGAFDEYDYRDAQGRITLDLHVFPTVPGNVVAMFLDISERKQARQEKIKMDMQLQQMRKWQSLAVLAGGVAHDFNNLIQGIFGNCEILREDIPEHDPTMIKRIASIEEAARRAADLSGQMLAYSGKGNFVLEPIDLAECVRNNHPNIEALIRDRAKWALEIAPGLPLVRADEAQVLRAIHNLIVNAAEAMDDPDKTIVIQLGLSRHNADKLSGALMNGEVDSQADYVYVCVRDEGMGMMPEMVESIFDPFYSTKFTGRGLGLPVVQGIMRGHGGAVTVETTPGEGSTFTLFFPVFRGEIPQPQAPPAPENSRWKAEGTVLVVDDEAIVREVVDEMLQTLGFQVYQAVDGVEAVELFEKHQDKIVCVLMDLTMPRMNGAEALRSIRRISTHVPVILSSGYSEEEVMAKFHPTEFADFIKKPYFYHELTAKIQSAIQGAQAT